MSIYNKLYWLTRLDGIQTLFAVIAILGITALIVMAIAYFVEEMSDYDKDDKPLVIFKKWLRVAIFTTIIFGMVAVFIPSKKDVIFIVAGGKTIEFIQSDTSINKIPEQTTKYISEFLEQQINELENGKTKDNVKD